MLERILKLYVMAMAGDVRSPLPHLFGPPGCGKSTVVEQAARILGVNLHIINVSRLSPLEVEGVQMPHTPEGEEMLLRMLTATFWTQLQDGDILLLDEFLRAFPEVYNALLDILTSRRVGAFHLPKVFIIGASNTTVSYDKALEDRLLHLPVADPRSNHKEMRRLQKMFVDELALLPEMAVSGELDDLFSDEVLPMFAILDTLKNKGSHTVMLEGHSMRNLIGQVRLREIQVPTLNEVLSWNNRNAVAKDKMQYIVLPSGKAPPEKYSKWLHGLDIDALLKAEKITAKQHLNIMLNKQLIGLEEARVQKGTTDDGVTDPTEDLFA